MMFSIIPMSPTSPLPAIASLLSAVAISLLLVKLYGAPLSQGRYASIDGLRGYLALFVFQCHSCVWYFYLRTGEWKEPPSNLYTHFGESSVVLFFMITGFLFFSKLIDGRSKRIDWARLFISRFLRLAPLYLFAMLLLFIVVAYGSNGIFNESIQKLLRGMVQWVSFSTLGTPDLNQFKNTFTIVAGVVWSLRYEWFFYFSLPILALTVKIIPPFPYIVLSIASIVVFAIIGVLGMSQLEMPRLMSFLGGIVACILARIEFCREFASRRGSSFLLLACITITVAFYSSAFKAVPLFLLSVAFAIIACGNNMFGVLISPASRFLGQMAYSIYLLHGITLFVAFNFILSVNKSRVLSPVSHWLIIVGITPILVFVCFLTFYFIERPAMKSTTIVTSWVRSLFPSF